MLGEVGMGPSQSSEMWLIARNDGQGWLGCLALNGGRWHCCSVQLWRADRRLLWLYLAVSGWWLNGLFDVCFICWSVVIGHSVLC